MSSKVDQVGEYLLKIIDKTWTTVDSNPVYMTHHNNANYLNSSVLDCVVNSSIVQPDTSTALNGCDIVSDYSNPITKIRFYDYNLSIRPYKFGLDSIASSVALNNEAITSTSYVYDSDIRKPKDLNMSYHRYGSIEAQGKDNVALSNFVDGCYARDIKIDSNKTNYSDNTMTFVGSVEASDGSNSRLSIVFNDINNTNNPMDVAKSNFVKSLNGKANVKIRYNFKREVDDAKNPQEITFKDMKVECKNSFDCSSYADGSSSYVTKGVKSFNDTVKFYYGKAHAPKKVISGNTGDVEINYEVYCYGATCDKTLLQTGSINSDDPRWWINTKHKSNYGKAGKNSGDIYQKRTPRHVRVNTLPTGNHQDEVNVTYDGTKGYPYRAIMSMKPDGWLVYNKYDKTATENEFEVQFNKDGSKWIGNGETDNSTETKHRGYKDRKLTW
jgi:hypothetical protein